MVAPPTYELQIEELVLHGWSARDARRIGMALERELMRLLQQDGVPSMLAKRGTTGRIDGGSIRVPLNRQPAAIGVQIARSVYAGIKKNSVSAPAAAPVTATPVIAAPVATAPVTASPVAAAPVAGIRQPVK